MSFAKLFFTWRTSFSLFRPREAVPLLLATLNTFKRTIVLLSRYFWWLVIATLIIDGIVMHSWREVLYSPFEWPAHPGYWLLNVLQAILFFVALLAARPSLETKNRSYFFSYFGRFPIVMTLWFICSIPVVPIRWIIPLFMLDAPFNLVSIPRSLWNGVKMCIWYAPIIVAWGFLVELLYMGLLQGLNYMLPIATPFVLFKICEFFVLLVSELFMLAGSAVLYTTIKHRDFSLFFPNNSGKI